MALRGALVVVNDLGSVDGQAEVRDTDGYLVTANLTEELQATLVVLGD